MRPQFLERFTMIDFYFRYAFILLIVLPLALGYADWRWGR